MSSDSRSGNSSSTCSLDSPAARRSSTSITRMRIPRIQGRPPHCSGLIVMRSSMYVAYQRLPLRLERSLNSTSHGFGPRSAEIRVLPLKSRLHTRCEAVPESIGNGMFGHLVDEVGFKPPMFAHVAYRLRLEAVNYLNIELCIRDLLPTYPDIRPRRTPSGGEISRHSGPEPGLDGEMSEHRRLGAG